MRKIRHVDCTDLWIQEKIRSELVGLEKVLDTENPADILKKYVDHSILASALERLNMKFMEGRPACAPAAMGIHGSTNPDYAISKGQ